MGFKISSFMIALIVGSFVMIGFTSYMSQLSDHYGTEFDNSSYNSYNTMQEINSLIEELENETITQQESSFVDDITGFFGDAYRVLKLTKKSYDTFDTMVDQAADDVEIGFIASPLKIMISGVVLILIVIALILRSFLKVEV